MPTKSDNQNAGVGKGNVEEKWKKAAGKLQVFSSLEKDGEGEDGAVYQETAGDGHEHGRKDDQAGVSKDNGKG